MNSSALMRHRAVGRVAVPATIVALAALAASSVARGHSSSDDFAELAAKVTPAVVNVSVEHAPRPASAGARPGAPVPGATPQDEMFRRFLERGGPRFRMPAPGKPGHQAVGSGFLIDAQGFVV